MDKLLLTTTEAATALGIGRSKVYELMQTGQLQSVHIGACRRVPADALTAFLEQLRAASCSRPPADALHSLLLDLRQGGRKARR